MRLQAPTMGFGPCWIDVDGVFVPLEGLPVKAHRLLASAKTFGRGV